MLKIQLINYYFLTINLKKKSFKKLKKYIYLFNNINFRFLILKFINIYYNKLNLTQFTILIVNNKLNLTIYIMNCLGNVLFTYSIKLMKKNKIDKLEILKHLLKVIFFKIKFLKLKPLIIHIYNLNLNYNWLLQNIYKKLFIINIKLFVFFSYNGCRKKKIKRKKF